MTEPNVETASLSGSGPRLWEAIAYAGRVHQGQFRKGSCIPYISHPLAACSFALSFGATEDEAIAAVLHDTAEDKGGESILEEIRTIWGGHVESVVRACSDSLVADPANKLPWRQRKEDHLLHLEAAGRSVLLVTASDKLHNLQCMISDLRITGPSVWQRFKTGPEEQLWYYDQCLRILSKVDSEPWNRPLLHAFGDLKTLYGVRS